MTFRLLRRYCWIFTHWPDRKCLVVPCPTFTKRLSVFGIAVVLFLSQEYARLRTELEDQHVNFVKWCETIFGEAVIAQMHLKAVRSFVESVLRYGLPVSPTPFTFGYSVVRGLHLANLVWSGCLRSIPLFTTQVNFEVAMILPQAKAESRLRAALQEMYGHLGGNWV